MLRPHLGDMARHLANHQRTIQIKTDLYRLSDELSSGKKSDLPRALGFSRARHAELVSTLSLNSAFSQLGEEVGVRLAAQQSALAQIGDRGSSLASDIIGLPLEPSQQDIARTARSAESDFIDDIAALRTSVAGQFVFSGAQSDHPPLPDGKTLLADLRATINMGGTSSQIVSDVRQFFTDTAGRYQTAHYAGGATPAETLRLGANINLAPSATALAPEIRDALAGVALAAIANDFATPLDPRAKDLIQTAREDLQNTAGLTAISARIGAAEHRVEEAQTRLSANTSAMQIELNSMEAADPFETAVRLQETQLQLETHFTSLARLSKLSLIYHMP